MGAICDFGASIYLLSQEPVKFLVCSLLGFSKQQNIYFTAIIAVFFLSLVVIFMPKEENGQNTCFEPLQKINYLALC